MIYRPASIIFSIPITIHQWGSTKTLNPTRGGCAFSASAWTVCRCVAGRSAAFLAQVSGRPRWTAPAARGPARRWRSGSDAATWSARLWPRGCRISGRCNFAVRRWTARRRTGGDRRSSPAGIVPAGSDRLPSTPSGCDAWRRRAGLLRCRPGSCSRLKKNQHRWVFLSPQNIDYVIA